MKDRLAWGIVGTGAIAGEFVTALARSRRCRVVNVVGLTAEAGAAFADQRRIPRWSETLNELLADGDVEAVYVATPHARHEEVALVCLEAGRPVLCEKPLTLDAAGATRLTQAAERRGVFLMEAYMYRCHPLIRQLMRRLTDDAIGAVRHVRASFGFRAPRDPSTRLFDPELGGGGILDVGGYPVSFARLVAGHAESRPFAEPAEVHAIGGHGPTGVDEWAAALLRFASGVTAEVACAVRHDLGTAATIYGERGRIELPDPWLPGGDRQGLTAAFTVLADDRPPETVTVRTEQPIYALQAELVADTLPLTQAPWPAMGWGDTLGNLRVLDRWRAAVSQPPTGRS